MDLASSLSKFEYKNRVVSINRLSELEQDIAEKRSEKLNKEFYHLRLAFFNFNAPTSLPDAKSIVIIAVPRPQAQGIFTLRGKKKTLIIPPTYVGYHQTTNQVGKLLKAKGYNIADTSLPLKLLSVRSGLAEYGRNNITYVSGMGSFFQLVGFYSNIPVEEETWRKPKAMEICQDCLSCQKACPTGAISSDRFLIHAECCITFHNEMKGDVQFPQWLKASWHNCLYGCFHCQRVCPLNKQFLNWKVERQEFSEEETQLLLKRKPINEIPAPLLEKLKTLELANPEALDNLPRNLSVLL